MHPDPIATWHRLVDTRDDAGLDALLADDVVFLSPVVHTPQVGKAIARRYLGAAFHVFFDDTFRYVRTFRSERDAALEFELELDGIRINGIDLIRWNDAGSDMSTSSALTTPPTPSPAFISMNWNP